MKNLLKIQTELKAPKNQFNKFGNYKYRSCEDILEAVKPHLKQTGCYLTINDEIIQVGDRIYVKASARFHDGDESISTEAYAREEPVKKGMDASQITGSASSYARKYALNGLFLIDDTKDSDSTNKHGKEDVEPNDQKKQLTKGAVMAKLKQCKSVEALKELWNMTTQKDREALKNDFNTKKAELS